MFYSMKYLTTGRKPLAVRRCLECNKQLCKRCVTQHQETKVTQAHTLYDLENTERHMCADHNTEAVRLVRGRQSCV